MSRLMRHNRLTILTLMCILLVFVSDLRYFFIPSLQYCLDQRRAVSDLVLWQSTRKWYENYLTLKEEKAAKANYLRSLVSELFYEDELHRLVSSIHQLSLTAHTELLRFQPGPVLNQPPYLAQNLQVYIKGSYREIIYFLKLIQELNLYQQLYFCIQPYEAKLQCVIDLHLYYQPGRRGG